MLEPYDEPPAKEVLDMIESIPRESNGYEQTSDSVVFPFSLDEFFNGFLANHAQYAYESFRVEIGEVVLDSFDWTEPEASCKEAFGRPTLEEKLLRI